MFRVGHGLGFRVGHGLGLKARLLGRLGGWVRLEL